LAAAGSVLGASSRRYGDLGGPRRGAGFAPSPWRGAWGSGHRQPRDLWGQGVGWGV